MGKTFEQQLADQVTAEVLPAVQQAVAQQITDSLIPTVASLGDKKADARNRATRTFLTNLGIDAAISILTVLATALVGLDITSKEAWTALGVLLAKTALSAPVSYVLRMRLTPVSPDVAIVAAPTSAPVAAPFWIEPTQPQET